MNCRNVFRAFRIFSDIEIILVDDGSTDSSPQICDNFASMDSRILVLHKENGGLSDTRNTGLLQAKGEYILFVDSDDYLEKDAIEQLLRGALPGIDLIAGAHSDWHGEKQIIRKRTGLQDGKIYTSKEFIINSLKIDRFIQVVSWSYMYRRDYLLENKLFFRKGWLYEDLDLILDLLLHTDSIIYIDYPFYNHVFRDGSIIISDISWKKIHDNVGVLKHWKETIDNVNDSTLQKFLYFELIANYLWMCKDKGIIGWWISGFNFHFAIIHSLGLKQKVKVILFELKTMYYKLFFHHSDSHLLPTSKHIQQLIAINHNHTNNE